LGRKRFLSTDMSGNPKIAAVAAKDTVAALAYGWLLPHMDDWGRRRADSDELKLNAFQAFPLLQALDIDRILSLLAEERLLVLYEVGGRQYIQCEPESFYEIQTYIKAVARQRDSSKCPPPYGHPWAAFWPESDWRPKPESNINAGRVTESSTELHRVAESATELHSVQKTAPSVLPFSSPLLTSPLNPAGATGAQSVEVQGSEERKAAIAYVNTFNGNWHLAGDKWKQVLEYGDDRENGWPLVVEAVKECAGAGSTDLNYLLKVLARWERDGITTAQQVVADRNRHETEKAKAAGNQRRGALGGRGQPERKSNVLLKGPPKSPEYYAHVYKKFEDGPPAPSGEDPPKEGDGRESA
jgi:DnaD/phage-associated family protein